MTKPAAGKAGLAMTNDRQSGRGHTVFWLAYLSIILLAGPNSVTAKMFKI